MKVVSLKKDDPMSNRKRRNAVKLKIDMGHDRVKTLYLKWKKQYIVYSKEDLVKGFSFTLSC